MKLSCMFFFLLVLIVFPQSLYPLFDREDVLIEVDRLEKYSNTMNVGVNTSFFRSIEDYNDHQVWQAMQHAGIKTIRFPGGLGNWYNWETGDIQTQGRAFFPFMKDGVHRNIPMLDIIEKAKLFNMNISFDMNLRENNESLVRLVHFWQKHHAPIHWVEMGNEYYTKKFSQEIGGARGYVRAAVRAAKVMKKAGYLGRIGITTAPEAIFGKKDRDDYIKWNQILTSMNLSIFDGVIMHYYPVASTIDGLLEAVPENFSNLARKFRSMFPGKEIWVTEWSIGRPATALMFNTVGHAILDLEMLNIFQREGVKLSIYHVFTGRGWEMWGYKRGDEHMKHQVIRRVPYFAFSDFNHASMNAKFYSLFEIDDFKGLLFWKIHQVSMLLWNNSPKYRVLSMVGQKLSFTLKKARVLHGDKLARNGSLLSQDADIEKLIPVPMETLEIPPYSFGLYHLSSKDKR